MTPVLLQVDALEKKFPVYGSFGKLLPPKSYVKALSDLSFHICEGETYGLVGESGCGKTTAGRSILGLAKPDAGTIAYAGTNLAALSDHQFRQYRKDLQFIFQDPFSSLNPRKRAGALLEEPLIVQQMGTQQERRNKVFEMLETVGLQKEHFYRFPHEFSGGQRQRLGIARALITEPKIIICDEPVSALDVAIQAQILNLLCRLKAKRKLTLLFITHDINVVRHISDRIGVMYLGQIVEEAPADVLFSQMQHPYTRALFSSVPDFAGHNARNRIYLKGEIPLLTDDFQGCPFHTRCFMAEDICRLETPGRTMLGDHHFSACHFADTND